MAEKVVVYITRGLEILVFDHLEAEPDVPMPQVPRGTLEPGEDPLAAAVREAREETGLELRHPVLLGSARRPHVFRGQAYDGLFHYAWLAAPAATPDAWSHVVSHGELDQGFTYHHRFVPLEGLALPWDLDLFLPELRARLVRERVVCYVTRGRRELLVFGHDDPGLEPGWQVVAGGVEPDEDPAEAAVREAWEESGLRLQGPVYLGTREYRPALEHARARRVERQHFFWLEAPPHAPDAWDHRVLNGEEDSGRVYRHRFMPIEDLELAEELGELLPRLKEKL
ncbi:RNA pyrophosphohydrolase [Calidithermus terrae]|uniref:RNA pyrophosphohydrolase n=1 Tax=Calidithermus terrae TaxID=1408545 RepID=A0A399EHQ4_9DEIN|nr:NUDIX domain-containing protein [Calidithermus terrae]RIH81801.1 RNA pyrophosphohydrolase [Calidithermus terrae]